MIHNIFKQHFPKAENIQISNLGNGNINDTYLVDFQEDNQDRKLVFQRLNTKIFNAPDKIAANIATIATHLRAKNYRYEILEMCLTAKKDEWRAFPFFENTYAPSRCENPQQAALAAQAFGHHFALLSDLETTKIHTILPRFHDAAWRWEQFENALAKPQLGRATIAANEINIALKNKALITHYQDIIIKIPQRITHNDTKISNLLFDSKTHQPRVIIDLDTLQPSTILGEFGDMVRTYCPSCDEDETDWENIIFRKEIYDALVKGFWAEAEFVMTKEEKECLFFAGELTIFVQALRFLTDFLNGDTYYKIKYDTHNWARTKNQLRLLDKMQRS